MPRLSFIFVIACLASLSLTAPSAVAFHGHHGYGYGCGGYGYGGYGGYCGGYGGYRGYGGYGYGGYYGGYLGSTGFYGPSYGLAASPYRYPAYYGQPYYSQPYVGQPYAATAAPGTLPGPNGVAAGAAAPAPGTTALAPPAYPNGQVSPAGYAAAAPAVAVTIQDDAFQQASITVQPGTIVRWTNTGSHVHTVTGQNTNWDSGDIAPGATYSATLQYPGTYQYTCRHHAGMQGTIVVGNAPAPAATQPGAPAADARSAGTTPARNY